MYTSVSEFTILHHASLVPYHVCEASSRKEKQKLLYIKLVSRDHTYVYVHVRNAPRYQIVLQSRKKTDLSTHAEMKRDKCQPNDLPFTNVE